MITPRNTGIGDTPIEITSPAPVDSELITYEGGELRAIDQAVFASETVRAQIAATPESSENERFLATYQQEYSVLPDSIKVGQSANWKLIEDRLLANKSEKLKLATEMQGGGQLVGIDKDGKALFKDRGTEPVMYGFDEDDRLMRIYDRNPDEMNKVKKWANYLEIRPQVLADGYELFADDGNYGLSDEMIQTQDHAKEVFIASKNREWRAAWLESGDKPDLVRNLYFYPVYGKLRVHNDNPNDRDRGRGVMRLLRV